MKKKNMIIIGIITLILVVAVGYALFSDTLTITGSATAKGNFELTYFCEKDLSGLASSGEGECSVNGSTVTTTSTFSKPRDGMVYVVTVTNTGTIPAVLKNVTSPNNYKEDMSGTGDEIYFDASSGLTALYMVCDDDALRECNYGIGNAVTNSAKITINPGESKYVAVMHSWGDLGEEQPKLPEKGASINYNLKFNFEQATN